MTVGSVVGRAGAVWLLLGACGAAACGGASKGDGGGSSDDGGSAGSLGGSAGSLGGSAGDTVSGGSGGRAGESGFAGSPAGGIAGSGGTGGSGGRGSVPGETADERDILDALGTTDATIDAASGRELMDLAAAVGVARGYAMCRCFFSPAGPPDDADMLMDCALEEVGALSVATTPDRARCITERMHEVAGFEDYLRCTLRSHRDNGLDWTEICERPGSMPEHPVSCELPAGAEELRFECDSTVYCPDGSSTVGHRCDQVPACPDRSDEYGCYDLAGRDLLQCGDAIWFPGSFCEQSECGAVATPPLCDPARPNRFLCGDGSDVGSDVVCDRIGDCADGADEEHCLR